jgi:hypothetical protein
LSALCNSEIIDRSNFHRLEAFFQRMGCKRMGTTSAALLHFDMISLQR